VVTYTPDANYVGSDSFTYTVSDGDLTDEGMVSVTVANVNHAPVAVDDAYTVFVNMPLTVSDQDGVLKNDSDLDGDNLIAILVDGTSHGSLQLNADGSFVYTPAADFYGTDSFTYKVFDGSAHSSTVTVTISVQVPIFLPLING